MEITKKVLMDSLKQCQAGIAKGKSRIDGADAFTFRDGKILTYNDDVAVCVPTEYTELDGTIKADVLLKLVPKLEGTFLIVVEEKGWSIHSGTTAIDLAYATSECETYIDQINMARDEWNPIPENFLSTLQICTVAKNRTDWDGTFFKDGLAMTTDLFRMVFSELSAPMDQFWLSQKDTVAISRLDTIIAYRVDPSWVQFLLNDETVHAVRRKADQAYPYEGMLGIYEQYKASTEREVLSYTFPEGTAEALARASVLSTSELDKPVVDMKFTRDSLQLSGSCASGKIAENLQWDEPYTCSEEFTVVMDSAFLMEAVKKSRNFYFLDSETLGALVVAGEDFLQITKAVRGK